MESGLSLGHSLLVSYDPAHRCVLKVHVITDFFEGVLVDDMFQQIEAISVVPEDLPACVPS